MLITEHVRTLVHQIDLKTEPQRLDRRLQELVTTLREACARPAVRARYAALARAPGILSPYPLDTDGYARSFDPLEDEEGFIAAWERYGIVVGRQVIPTDLRDAAIARLHKLVLDLSEGACDLAHPDTWGALPTDAAGVPVLTRGFFEIYHDALLAELRQAVRVYVHHVLLWGQADLWTSFDRFGMKLPGHAESRALPLHVDQNPLIHPDFRTIQGVLALSDCPVERGTYVGVPGSKALFPGYAAIAPPRGEYVELSPSAEMAPTLAGLAQPLPLRGGDLVSWDSRTTHANTENRSGDIRMVALIAAGPAHEHDPSARLAREDAFRSGLGSNVRDALMHASKKPRFTDPEAANRVRIPERLTLLGRLLYGQRSYETL